MIWRDLCAITPTCDYGVEAKINKVFLLADGNADGVVDGVVAEVGAKRTTRRNGPHWDQIQNG